MYAADPTPTYRWLRHHAPVYYDDINGIWGISRYHDVIAVEKNGGRYSNRNAYRPFLDQTGVDDLSMIGQDDPVHTSQRRLVARRFTPRAVSGHEERIRDRVRGLLDAAVTAGGAGGSGSTGVVDVVQSLAAPLPAMMIAEALGFGVDRWPEVQRWSEETIALGGGPRYLDEVGMTAAFEFAGACSELIAETRAALAAGEDPGHMVATWCSRLVDGEPMTDEQVISECLLLVDGGAETTRTVIADTVWNLCNHPDQLSLLRGDPSLLGTTAVEEFIRYTTPVLNMSRKVTEDHELHGQQLKAGDWVLLMYSSANRDETVFDDPDRFDLTRQHNNHVSFGFGTHFCLGSSLARLEIRVMFEELLERWSSFALVEEDQPQRVPGAFVRGIGRLPVRFTVR